MDKHQLEIGPIGEAEEIFGKSWHDFNKVEEILSLRIALGHNRQREEHFEALEDTYYTAPYSRAVKILCDFGFIRLWWGIGRHAPGRPLDSREVWALRNHILISIESYTYVDGEVPTMNRGSIAACVPISAWKFLPGGSGYYNHEEDRAVMSWDAREGLRALLNQLTLLTLKPLPWTRAPISFEVLIPGEYQSNSSLNDYSQIVKKAEQERLPIIARALGLEYLWPGMWG